MAHSCLRPRSGVAQCPSLVSRNNYLVRRNPRISNVICVYTALAVFPSLGAMPYGQSYRKQAYLRGVLLALADNNVHQRAVVLHEIRETTARLKRKSPIFAGRLFARLVARTAFPTNPEKESQTPAELPKRLRG